MRIGVAKPNKHHVSTVSNLAGLIGFVMGLYSFLVLRRRVQGLIGLYRVILELTMENREFTIGPEVRQILLSKDFPHSAREAVRVARQLEEDWRRRNLPTFPDGERDQGTLCGKIRPGAGITTSWPQVVSERLREVRIMAELVPEQYIQGQPLTPVEEIIWHEVRADELQAEADAHRWQAARLIYEQLVLGMTQRELARLIGKSQPHVRYMSETWKHFGGLGDHLGYRPPFNEAYHSAEVRGSRRSSAGELRIPDIETLADAILGDELIADIVDRALERAKQMRAELEEQNPDRLAGQRQRRAVKASRIFSAIMANVQRFVEEFRTEPGQEEAAEKVAESLETAAAMIRQRIGI